jgi:hypothetical protein
MRFITGSGYSNRMVGGRWWIVAVPVPGYGDPVLPTPVKTTDPGSAVRFMVLGLRARG